MTHHSYSIPMVTSDLRREETIHQICDSLLYLDKISTDIFTRISDRVNENQAQMRSINQRIDLAQAKINSLKGSHKATKVFSSAKYPSTNKDGHKQARVFSNNDQLNTMPRTTHNIQGQHLTKVDDQLLKEKLQFFNVNLKAKRDQHMNLVGHQGEGLGRLPAQIDSVSSLLLFNTSENPYKKYILLDPLGVVTKTRESEEDTTLGLAEAPRTIIDGEGLHRHDNQSMFYTPVAGDVPEIAVPDFLPDLIGVADDMLYVGDLGPSIAPSAPLASVPDLPEIVPEDVPGASDVLPSGPATMISSGPPAPPPQAPPPPPQAPPPPPVAPPPPPPVAPPTSAVAPPPPPPGPPPPLAVPAQQADGPTAKAPAVALPSDSNTDGRSSLMDAIRKAGGTKNASLKSGKKRRLEDKKKKQEEKNQPSEGGGNLMGDLFKALTMRRKGISGSKSAGAAPPGGGSSDGPTTTMDRMSAMIPTSPVTNDPDDDEDWN